VTSNAAGGRRIYQSRDRQRLIAASLIALLVAGSSLIFEKDPETGLLPVPNDYLWVVIPGILLIFALAWRALRVRVETDLGGIDMVRVVGHERLPWSSVRRFEVHPTPGRQGSVVLARTDGEILVKVRSELFVRPLRDRGEARRRARARADVLAAQLEADRVERQSELLARAAARAGSAPPASSAAAGGG